MRGKSLASPWFTLEHADKQELAENAGSQKYAPAGIESQKRGKWWRNLWKAAGSVSVDRNGIVHHQKEELHKKHGEEDQPETESPTASLSSHGIDGERVPTHRLHRLLITRMNMDNVSLLLSKSHIYFSFGQFRLRIIEEKEFWEIKFYLSQTDTIPNHHSYCLKSGFSC